MKAVYILVGYGLLCLLMAIVFSVNVSKEQVANLSGEGGLFGPLVVKEKNSSYDISIENPVALNKWSYIEVDVLDSNKNHLFSFGDEMWHQRGRDSDGPWHESKSKYSMDVTFKKPGNYYFDVKAQRNDGQGNKITLVVVQERGSNIAFLMLGIGSLILALAVSYFSNGLAFKETNVEEKLDEEVSITRKLISISRTTIILFSVLLVFFILALIYSFRGWGYMGYNGYHRGPSSFYWGSPSIYHGRSTRNGSVSGLGHRGGGPHGGK